MNRNRRNARKVREKTSAGTLPREANVVDSGRYQHFQSQKTTDFIKRSMRLLSGIGTIAVVCLLTCCSEPRYPAPLTPEEALNAFQLREGFEIELFAAEPFVMDPVEMIFDEQGNAFVVEMPDYPFPPGAGNGAGRIKALLDTNADGRIDRSIVFADSITEGTSMLPWKQGLIVASAPYILYLKDTNGDFVADTREVLFSGFFASNSEAQITSLRFGIDNWIYAANNGQSGEVIFHRKPEAPALSMGGADFRFRLDRGEFEREAGAAQFGHTMDDWGHRFITQNTLHIRHVVIPWRYLHRHPHLSSTAALVNISDHDLEMFQQTPPPYWRAERTRRRQKQYAEENLDREEYAEDHFTGCSGGTIYDGDAFPPAYYGNVFTGDVAGNLVHRDVLFPLNDRPTFVARRDEAEKDREFLASTDPWFRPANFAIGPDGSLYVIDMYRQHIETPLSIPEDLKADMDFLSGSDLGRIYRIVPDKIEGKNLPASNPGEMSSAELVAALGHPNRWWRLQAQRLILERQDMSALPAVIDLFSKHEIPVVRLHALYVVEGLNALDAGLVSQALRDPHPGVRKHGLILSERYPQLLPRLHAMLNDSSIQVVFQAVLSLGWSSDKNAIEDLAKALAVHGNDPLFRTAVLSSNAGTSSLLVDELINKYSFFEKPEPWKGSLTEELFNAIGSSNQTDEIDRVLKILRSQEMKTQPQWQLAGIKGLKKGMQRSAGEDGERKAKLESIQSNDAGKIEEAIQQLQDLNTKSGSFKLKR